MWDLPGPGLEPVSPALAGGFLTTAPPGEASPLLIEDTDTDASVVLRPRSEYRVLTPVRLPAAGPLLAPYCLLSNVPPLNDGVSHGPAF